MSDKRPPERIQPPSKEVIEEIHKRTAEAGDGLPGLAPLVTVEQVTMMLLTATPPTPKKKKE